MTTEKRYDVVTFERTPAGEIALIDPDTGDWYDQAAARKPTGSVTVTAVDRSAGVVTYAGAEPPAVVHRDISPQNRKARRAARKAR